MTPSDKKAGGGPDRTAALQSYRERAAGYDRSSTYILAIRAMAIQLLGVRPGKVVFDVACGTGPTLLPLAETEDAAVEVIEAPVEDAILPARADALLFCYTHDVLQNPRALANLFAAAKPGARVVVVGIWLVSWWLAPLNLWTCWRTRDYLSTFRGLSQPWAPLRAYCPDLTIVRTYQAGTSYLASGRTPLATCTARTPGAPGAGSSAKTVGASSSPDG